MITECDWLDPASLQVGWLNNETKPGLFLSPPNGVLVWVVEIEGVAYGVRISPPAPFLTWRLEAGFDISGVHLGRVQLQLDSTAIDMPHNLLTPGDLLLEGNAVLLQAATDRPHMRAPSLKVAQLAEADPHPLTFRCTKWALVRPGEEERTEVFRRDPNAATQE